MSVSKLTPAFVAKSLGIHLPGILVDENSQERDASLETPFSLLVTDSRKIVPGCLFVAIKGEKMDGHDFIDQAIEKGATGILCSDQRTVHAFKTVKVFPVADTLTAIRKLAKDWRALFDIPVIAVCGSVGKTTTKELLGSILLGRWKDVLKTSGSQNGFLGIPITLLELRPEHGVAIIEVGIDEIGAMAQHMELVQPTHAIMTAIGPEHLEKLIDVPTVAREENLALQWVARLGGSIALNLDDPWVQPLTHEIHPKQALGYTLGDPELPENWKRSDILKSIYLSEFSILKSESDPVELKLPLPGIHNARNTLGAVALAKLLGLSGQEIQAGLSGFKGAKGRSEVKTLSLSPLGKGEGSVTLLCDYYNANPSSVEAGLDVLASLSASQPRSRKIACLGDMLELGVEEKFLHEGLSQKIIANRIDQVLLYGPKMHWLEQRLRSDRNFHGKLLHFDDQNALAKELTHELKDGDFVLLKGSRGMKMEEIHKRLDPHFT